MKNILTAFSLSFCLASAVAFGNERLSQTPDPTPTEPRWTCTVTSWKNYNQYSASGASLEEAAENAYRRCVNSEENRIWCEDEPVCRQIEDQ